MAFTEKHRIFSSSMSSEHYSSYSATTRTGPLARVQQSERYVRTKNSNLFLEKKAITFKNINNSSITKLDAQQKSEPLRTSQETLPLVHWFVSILGSVVARLDYELSLFRLVR